MSRVHVFISAFILLGMLAILIAFIVLPDSGPFDKGDTPSLVSP